MPFFVKKTRITIDYTRCGDGIGVDPRTCRKCLTTCEPAVFLLHQTLNSEQVDEHNPDKWRVTPLWLSLCTRCNQCVEVCPEHAIRLH
jgi:NAD-dependent dihydropyrimidine dehydrogenase PreA subunit